MCLSFSQFDTNDPTAQSKPFTLSYLTLPPSAPSSLTLLIAITNRFSNKTLLNIQIIGTFILTLKNSTLVPLDPQSPSLGLCLFLSVNSVSRGSSKLSFLHIDMLLLKHTWSFIVKAYSTITFCQFHICWNRSSRKMLKLC